MIKKAFTWFFCNLYYFYAKKKHRYSDKGIVLTFGTWLSAFFGLFGIFLFLYITGVKLNKGFVRIIGMLVFTMMEVIVYFFLYKNGAYKKMLSEFDERKYDKLIVVYTILICVVLPLGFGFLMKHLFAR